jgi:multiple sugar transport system substrate-binding protein
MPVSRRRLLVAGGVGATAGLLGLGELLRRSGADRSPEPGPLTVMSGRDQSLGGQRQRLVNQWEAEHPDNPVRILEVGGVADAHRSEMVARAQSGRVAWDEDYHVDIYNLDVTWTAEFVEAGYLHELRTDGLDLTGFLDQPLRSCRYGDQLWALPFNTDAGLLYYRDDLVPQARDQLVTGPPDSPAPGALWGGIDTLVATALADPDRPVELVAGWAGQLADYEGLTVNALELIWANGGDVVRGDWRDPVIEVGADPVRGALAELARVHQDEPAPLILPQAVEFDEDASREAFRAGQVLFMRHWPVAFRSLTQPPAGDASSVAGQVAEHTRVRTLPGPSVLGGQNLAIARETPRRDAAQALIEFLTSQSSQTQLFRDGGLPATRTAVYHDPAVTAVHRYAPELLAAVEAARPRPVTPYYARFSEVFRAGVRQAMRRQGVLPEGFADQLRDALQGRQR